MVKDILYSWALDENDNPIHINVAEKEGTFYCPGCKGEFILRKSGKTGKWSKRPHFAHKNPTTNCTGESYLHNTFKKSLVRLLERYKAENKALIINWNCKTCSAKYEGDLLITTPAIREEYDLKVCRPDIALLGADGKVMAAVEIVFTHEPEENVLQYYKTNGISLIQINLFFIEDLDRVEEKIINPDIVNFCRNPKCPNLRYDEAGRNLIVSDIECKRCHHPMHTCHVEVNSVFGKLPVALTEAEIRSAQSEGVRFIISEDKTTKKKHLGIRCPHCMPTKIKVRPVIKRPMRRDKRNRPFD